MSISKSLGNYQWNHKRYNKSICGYNHLVKNKQSPTSSNEEKRSIGPKNHSVAKLGTWKKCGNIIPLSNVTLSYELYIMASQKVYSSTANAIITTSLALAWMHGDTLG